MSINHFDITSPAALAAMAQQEKIDLTLGQAKMLTKAIKNNLNTLPAYIMICLKGKAYKAMGYNSVAEWALAEFGLSRSRIYQLNAVASAEHAIRSQFELSASFTLSEGNFRPLAGDIEAVLSSISADFADSDAATESAREQVVNQSISKMMRALEQKERGVRVTAAPAPAAITDITAKAERVTASAENVVAFTPRGESNKHIGAVPLSYELAVVKARDTGKVLMCLSPDADADMLRDALLDAQAVIAELLPFVVAAAA